MKMGIQITELSVKVKGERREMRQEKGCRNRGER